MKKELLCPKCGSVMLTYKNPLPTVDIVIRNQGGIVLIRRKNPPFGWALPGGFVDYGESVEQAAVREAREETSLDVCNLKLLGVYSAPDRDPRHHTISTVLIVDSMGTPKSGDDASEVQVFHRDNLPSELAFDHGKILEDFFRYEIFLIG
ncbi:MAG: NUDIX hydrolase [Deltaproteobacteria bacterium]|nr:NUDIX hydrolase [Deltaproteobacteria bacterium]